MGSCTAIRALGIPDSKRPSMAAVLTGYDALRPHKNAAARRARGLGPCRKRCHTARKCAILSQSGPMTRYNSPTTRTLALVICLVAELGCHQTSGSLSPVYSGETAPGVYGFRDLSATLRSVFGTSDGSVVCPRPSSVNRYLDTSGPGGGVRTIARVNRGGDAGR